MLNYPWLMLLFPALGALIISLFGTRLGRRAVGILAPAMVALSFIVAAWIFVLLVGLPEDQRSHTVTLWSWMTAGKFHVDASLLVDQLSILMALVVTGISFLIHIYSNAYMEDDPRFPRFFAYLNFFVLMMLVLVLADNYLLLFVGWEGVGLASYLLIGFWFDRPTAADAGKKAFIVNRIGDFGLLIAIFLIWTSVGSLRFQDVFSQAGTQAIVAAGVMTATTLLMLLACTGKSAQIPLFVWLPDAMEGPTPVSALIHAATMVTAGVYLVARSHTLFTASPTGANWTAWIGVLTAFFAATIALTVTDLKRILAYSTISQLGFMFTAVGVGAYTAGIFHLVTHAFFKALLFLAAGSVMHALHGELDIRKMGNLRAKMPTTTWTFVIGAAALAGVPFFSGFFSKDEILYYDFEKSPLLWAIGAATALLTALYAFRMVFLAFWGKERDRRLWDHAHESPRLMTVPLIVLAIGALFAGYIGLPRISFFARWLDPLLGLPPELPPTNIPVEWILLAISAIVSVVGVYLAYYFWVQHLDVPKRIRTSLGAISSLVEHKYYVDEAYNAVIVVPLRDLSNWLATVVDKLGIDGAVNGVGSITGWCGVQVRKLQTGLVGLYALSILFGAVALVAWLLIR